MAVWLLRAIRADVWNVNRRTNEFHEYLRRNLLMSFSSSRSKLCLHEWCNSLFISLLGDMDDLRGFVKTQIPPLEIAKSWGLLDCFSFDMSSLASARRHRSQALPITAQQKVSSTYLCPKIDIIVHVLLSLSWRKTSAFFWMLFSCPPM